MARLSTLGRARSLGDAGIGEAHFPITTKNPEVQRWFDQGNALLHSFWDYEGERAFRWCLKLEAGQCHALLGIGACQHAARPGRPGPAGGDDSRSGEAQRPGEPAGTALYRRHGRGRAARSAARPAGADNERQDGSARAKKILETICVKYPDDMEARALLALRTMASSRYGAELMIREILLKQPDHPGAHHYRIHDWDYHEPEQALGSARRYGEIVTAVGHALHMPGHIFSIVGMWKRSRHLHGFGHAARETVHAGAAHVSVQQL